MIYELLEAIPAEQFIQPLRIRVADHNPLEWLDMCSFHYNFKSRSWIRVCYYRKQNLFWHALAAGTDFIGLLRILPFRWLLIALISMHAYFSSFVS